MQRSVYLNTTYREMLVSAEGYQQIVEIARQHALCGECHAPFTVENPMVAGISCLDCFLKNEQQGLTFQGAIDPEGLDLYQSPNDPYENLCYLFLDKHCHCFVTEAGPGKERYKAREMSRYTLQYWHFPVPEMAVINQTEVKTHGWGWEIHGDVKRDVVLIQHGETCYKNLVLFIAIKSTRDLIQINKRKAIHRELFTQARAELEASRSPYGMYWIEGEWHPCIQENDVYRLVARKIEEEL